LSKNRKDFPAEGRRNRFRRASGRHARLPKEPLPPKNSARTINFEGTVRNGRQAGKMSAAPIRTPARRKPAAASGTLRDDGRPHNV
jgi:hypothetical protein